MIRCLFLCATRFNFLIVFRIWKLRGGGGDHQKLPPYMAHWLVFLIKKVVYYYKQVLYIQVSNHPPLRAYIFTTDRFIQHWISDNIFFIRT